ncbi:MAG TPA: FAD-binding oxidoreductase [Candidatus Krumholzibacteria bacterium]|nr:FAD-binding oxidoreductase [Candidatus Krumholzibacteria bacterium]
MNDSALLGALRADVGESAVLTVPEDRAPYEKGWRYGEGRARAVVLPSSTEGVAAVMRRCAEHGVRLQPMGANTGLVAASNPDASGEQLVMGLQRLDRIVGIDPVDRVAVVEAGVGLGTLNEALREYGLWYPIDLGADPQVGGMVATNTGGTRLVRYGDVRSNLLGVEVVLADGTVMRRLQPLRKNNTGLDPAQLFVGTSGSFGVITRAALDLAPLPVQTTTLLFAIDEGAVALDLLSRLERTLGDFLAAFEVISREAIEVTVRRGSRVRDPFPDRDPSMVALVEFATSCTPERLDLPTLVLGTVSGVAATVAGVDDDAILLEQDDAFWHLRHSVTEAIRLEGEVLAFDLSVPRSRLAEFSEAIRRRVAERWPSLRVCDYGHWGDGGTHVNLLIDPNDPATRDLRPGSESWLSLQDSIYALCVEDFGGSYSAEHGVGPHNQRVYDRYADPATVAVSDVLKRHFDPDDRLGTVRWGRP